MTLAGHFTLHSVLRHMLSLEIVAFEDNYCLQTNKDRPTLSATQMFNRDSWFLAIYGLCGYPRGSLKRQKTSNDSAIVRYTHVLHIGVALFYPLFV